MTDQLALDFDRLAGEGPIVEKFQVEEMIDELRGKDWQTARDLGGRKESDKRMLRAIAKSSEGRIISGQKGYTHFGIDAGGDPIGRLAKEPGRQDAAPLGADSAHLSSSAATAAMSLACFHFWCRWRQRRGDSFFTFNFVGHLLFFSQLFRGPFLFILISVCQITLSDRPRPTSALELLCAL